MADVHVQEDGDPNTSTLLLLTNAAAPSASWTPIVPALAESHHVVRVDLIGHDRYDVPTQARRIAAVVDRLGTRRVTAVGHSSGCMLATALTEIRPDLVEAVAILDMGPDLSAQLPESLLFRLVRARFPGALLWRLRTPKNMVRAARGTAQGVEIPESWFEHLALLTHRDFRGMMGAYTDYLEERSLPDRLRDKNVPLLVIFGADDERWRASSAEAYRTVPGARIELLPGVGHTPPVEAPEDTAALLLAFAATLVR
ncbi:alpha/beta fold hydrolase [Cryptosporangium sp. NPDC048952]|uniref:alpha/beta fold hydrolase n=1 Tax=Cryptosporangium sp. NPDC048952 TaxID=3363961 RepID=UPI003722EDBE